MSGQSTCQSIEHAIEYKNIQAVPGVEDQWKHHFHFFMSTFRVLLSPLNTT